MPIDSDMDIAQVVNASPHWFHSIRLSDNLVTPGHKTLPIIESELHIQNWPDLRGKTVLDIGAWDGAFSFEAERRGAARVVALDHYVWSLDLHKVGILRSQWKKAGITEPPLETVPEVWHPDSLPGRACFDLAKRVLNSQVEPVVDDFMKMDLESLGTFDVVLYLGVLYHIHNPLEGLKRLARVTRELAIIETHAVIYHDIEGASLCEFHEHDSLNGDPTLWWVPTLIALEAMCRTAGFSRVESMMKAPERKRKFRLRPRFSTSPDDTKTYYRATVHAWK